MKHFIPFFCVLMLFSCSKKPSKIAVPQVKKVELSQKKYTHSSCDEKRVLLVYDFLKDHNIINKRGYHKVGRPYKIDGVEFWPRTQKVYSETGRASWYGTKFYNKNTANGEIFKKGDLTAAHRTLPLPSLVRVTNLENGKTIVLKVNDRGPFVKSKERIIDVSEEAAVRLGFKNQGTAKVRVELLEYATQELNQCICAKNPKHYTNSFHCREYNVNNKYSKGQSHIKTEFYGKNAS